MVKTFGQVIAHHITDAVRFRMDKVFINDDGVSYVRHEIFRNGVKVDSVSNRQEAFHSFRAFIKKG